MIHHLKDKTEIKNLTMRWKPFDVEIQALFIYLFIYNFQDLFSLGSYIRLNL